MTILSVKNLIIDFGERRILNGINVACEEGTIVGLIGSNGAGKTTLFNVIAGFLEPTDGAVEYSKKARIGYLRQNSGLSGGRTILEELRSVVAEGLAAIERLPQTTDPQEYAHLQAIIDATDAYHIDYRIQTVLQGLGFGGRDLSMQISDLSGGEMTRLAIAKLLVEQPNLLLLDEPTNHLDFRTIAWLEDYIKDYKGTVIVVSHDRFFLDRCVDEIWEMEQGSLRRYLGNYSAFKEQKALWIKEQERLFEKQEQTVAKLTDYIDRNLVRASTSAMAKSRRKQLEKMELIERPKEVVRRLNLKFPVDRGGGNDVLQCRELTVEVGNGHRLFTDLSLQMQKGEKIAIVGDNGCGKTTLLNALLGEISLLNGKIRWGAGVEHGTFRQAIHFEDENRSVLEELAEYFPNLTYHDLRSALARVSFLGEEVELKVGTLSGGERARFQFALLMLLRRNTLIFDEPTNHLDLPAREEVERALDDFSGNLLVVSHDRYFLSKVPTRILKLDRFGLHELKNIEEYWAEEKQPQPAADNEKKQSHGNYKSKEDRAREAAKRQEISKIDRRLAEIEENLLFFEEQMSKAEADYEALQKICIEMEALKEEQDALTEEWLILNE